MHAIYEKNVTLVQAIVHQQAGTPISDTTSKINVMSEYVLIVLVFHQSNPIVWYMQP